MISVILASIVITVVVYIKYTTNEIHYKQDYKKGQKNFIAAAPGQPFMLKTQEETLDMKDILTLFVALIEFCQSIIIAMIFYRGLTYYM